MNYTTNSWKGVEKSNKKRDNPAKQEARFLVSGFLLLV